MLSYCAVVKPPAGLLVSETMITCCLTDLTWPTRVSSDPLHPCATFRFIRSPTEGTPTVISLRGPRPVDARRCTWWFPLRKTWWARAEVLVDPRLVGRRTAEHRAGGELVGRGRPGHRLDARGRHRQRERRGAG